MIHFADSLSGEYARRGNLMDDEAASVDVSAVLRLGSGMLMELIFSSRCLGISTALLRGSKKACLKVQVAIPVPDGWDSSSGFYGRPQCDLKNHRKRENTPQNKKINFNRLFSGFGALPKELAGTKERISAITGSWTVNVHFFSLRLNSQPQGKDV